MSTDADRRLGSGIRSSNSNSNSIATSSKLIPVSIAIYSHRSQVPCDSCQQFIPPWSVRLTIESDRRSRSGADQHRSANENQSERFNFTHHHLPCIGFDQAILLVQQYSSFYSIPGFSSLSRMNQRYAHRHLFPLLSKAADKLGRSFDFDLLNNQGKGSIESRRNIALVLKSDGVPHRLIELMDEERQKEEKEKEKKRQKNLNQQKASDAAVLRAEHEIRQLGKIKRELRERPFTREAKELNTDELPLPSLKEVILPDSGKEKVGEPMDLIRLMEIDKEKSKYGQQQRLEDERSIKKKPVTEEQESEGEEQEEEEEESPQEEGSSEPKFDQLSVSHNRSISGSSDLTKSHNRSISGSTKGKAEMADEGTEGQASRGKKYERQTAIQPSS